MERRRVNEDEEGIMYACECACGGWNTTACESIEEAIYHYKLMNVGAPIYTYTLYLPCDFAEQMDAINRAYQDMRKIEQQFRQKTETEDMMEAT